MNATPSTTLCLLSAFTLLAQPQEAWVARYNGGATNKSHAPLALQLDSAGNIYVAGSSQNASNVTDYAVLKYAPNGTLLYETRYGSGSGTNYTLNGFALDRSGSAHLTGTGGTLKLTTNGGTSWTAPYAGKDVAVDPEANVYVTGFATNRYATVKLDAAGSNLWVRTYVGEYGGPDESYEWHTQSQKVAPDALGRVYVAGWEAWGPALSCGVGKTNWCRYSRPSMLAYDADGSCLWTNTFSGGGINWGAFKGLLPDNQGNVHVTGNGDSAYRTSKVDASGQMEWSWSYSPPGVTAMALDGNGNPHLTGSVFKRFSDDTTFTTLKLNASGQVGWQTNYQGPVSGKQEARGIALDNSGNVYVTGVSTNAGTFNDFATIKYDPDGHELWVQRYNGPANGNDGATAISVAPDGSIYVTGYSANAAGGSDISTIKYVQPTTTIQKKTDGSIQLQGLGAPGSNYTVRAGTNLQDWADLGSSLADTNGLFEFIDTNAPFFPYRFYRWFGP